jgi:RHS repeat-associated protein
MDEFEAQDAMRVDYGYEMGRGEGTLTVGSGEQFPAVVHAPRRTVLAYPAGGTADPSGRFALVYGYRVMLHAGTGVIGQSLTCDVAGGSFGGDPASDVGYGALDRFDRALHVNWAVRGAAAPERLSYWRDQYDAWNRLVRVEGLIGQTWQYEYDGLGRRIIKRRVEATVPEVRARHFYYDDQWRVLEERLEPSAEDQRAGAKPWQGVTDKRYVWGLRGPGDLLLRDSSQFGSPAGALDQRLWSISDSMGSVLSLYEEQPDGASDPIKWRFAYEPYGAPEFLTPDFAPTTVQTADWNILFGGYYYDPETGLYHVRNRFYDPNLGRFLQTDPSGFQDSYNLYQYALSAPQTYLDPTGEALPLILLAGALAIGAAHGWSETMLATEGQATGRQQLVGAGLGGLFGAVNPVGAYSSATGAAAGYWGGRLTGSWDPVAGMQWGGLAGGVGGGFGSAARQAYRAAAGDLGRRAAVRAAAGAGARRALPEVYGAAAGAIGFELAGRDPLHGATLGMFAVGAFSGGVRRMLARRAPPGQVYSVKGNVSKIWGSERIIGMTEGTTWALASRPPRGFWRSMLDPWGRRDPGTIIFRGAGAQSYHAHPVFGIWSGLKNVLGQRTSGFGDLTFSRSRSHRIGRVIGIREAAAVPHLPEYARKARNHQLEACAFDFLLTEVPLAAAAYAYALIEDL